MFLKRKTLKVSNAHNLEPLQNNKSKKSTFLGSQKSFHNNDIQLTQYPSMQYFIGFSLIGLSIYFLYSASGSKNSIPGFNQNLWWQYVIALIPMIFGWTIFIVCQSESILISKLQNYISIQKKRLFFIVSNKIQRQFQDINGLSIIKKGTQNSNLPNRMYYIVITFKSCESYQVLGCISSISIKQYYQEFKKAFTQSETSQHRIIIQNFQQME